MSVEQEGAPRISISIPCSGSVMAAGFLSMLLVAPQPVEATSLSPSRAGLLRQVQAAKSHGYPHLATEEQVREAVRAGRLVHLPGNRDYRVNDTVSFPFAQPEVKLFVERLSQQYRRGCGEQLVVTSLVRPRNRQPPNASSLSVHPTGMALDLRVSGSSRCRSWLERTLVGLKSRGVLEAARERRPPHYHVVVFPRQYARYVAARAGTTALAAVDQAPAAQIRYRVRAGDSLWSIARHHGTTVTELQRINGLTGSTLRPGQILLIRTPSAGSVVATSNHYSVRPGDSLWGIARRHGTTVESLRHANGLPGTRLHPGQVLEIPSD